MLFKKFLILIIAVALSIPIKAQEDISFLTKQFTTYLKSNKDSSFYFLKQVQKASVGSNAKLFTGHTNDAVLKSHYLNGAFLAGNLGDFSVF